MRRITPLIVVAVVLAAGCGKVAREVAKKAASKSARTAPKAAKGAGRILPMKPPAVKPVSPFLRTSATAVTTAASRSQGVGNLLAAAKTRIPPHVYASLWKEWQRNDAEIRGLEWTLRFGNPEFPERLSASARIGELEKRNAEIERQVREYG